MLRHTTGTLLFLSTLSLSSAVAQQHLATKELQAGNTQHFGTSIARLGDIDGDGVPDFAVGAPGGGGSSNPPAGHVYVYSGSSGSLLYTLTGTATGDSFGVSVANAGDVNGDGKSDLVVGAFSWRTYAANRETKPNGYARIYSGGTGTLVRDLAIPDGVQQFGWQVAGVGDVNGDGVPDQAVSAPATAAQPHGKVAVYSGSSGERIYLLTNDGLTEGGFGYSVASGGDLTGDGRPDILIGDFSTHNKGSVKVYSGANGSLVRTIYGSPEDRLFGACIAGGPDVNNDGVPDIAVSAIRSVRIFSGATGAELYHVLGSDTLRIGMSIDLVGDITGDGHPDLLVGEPSQMVVHTYSLFSGTMTEGSISAPAPYAMRFGISLCSLSPTALAIGADYATVPDAGNVGAAWTINPATGQVLHTFKP